MESLLLTRLAREAAAACGADTRQRREGKPPSGSMGASRVRRAATRWHRGAISAAATLLAFLVALAVATTANAQSGAVSADSNATTDTYYTGAILSSRTGNDLIADVFWADLAYELHTAGFSYEDSEREVRRLQQGWKDNNLDSAAARRSKNASEFVMDLQGWAATNSLTYPAGKMLEYWSKELFLDDWR